VVFYVYNNIGFCIVDRNDLICTMVVEIKSKYPNQ